MKKKLPLAVLETLEKFVQLKGEQFEVVNPDQFLVKIIDKDIKSDFYFNIETFKIENGLKLIIDYKPHSKLNLSNVRFEIDEKGLGAQFNNWISLLKGYETVNSFFDDPIIKSFAEEYFAEFEIIDKDADTKPFSTKQILLIDEHLDYIENNIDKFKTNQNEIQILGIKEEVKILRENLTTKPKVFIVKSLSLIWAKLTKQGTQFLKEFLTEAKKQAIREGVKYLFDVGVEYVKQKSQ